MPKLINCCSNVKLLPFLLWCTLLPLQTHKESTMAAFPRSVYKLIWMRVTLKQAICVPFNLENHINIFTK
jgi:hypothetical protein